MPKILQTVTLCLLLLVLDEFEEAFVEIIKEYVYDSLVTISFNEYFRTAFELPESKSHLNIFPSKFYGIFDDIEKAIVRKATITCRESQRITTGNYGSDRIGITYTCDIDILIKYIDDKQYYIVFRTQEYGHSMSSVCEIEYDDISIYRTNSKDTTGIHKINTYCAVIPD